MLVRKQVLKNGLLNFVKESENIAELYSISTDINKGYWLYKGVLYDNSVYNIHAAKKVKINQLQKDTVYYITTMNENTKKLCNVL